MTPERHSQLDHIFMGFAESLATMSFGTRSKVGAVLVKDTNVFAHGWNGMPSGLPNTEMEYIENGELVTNPLVLHAESNAIMRAVQIVGASSAGATLYVTLSPCVQCVKLIIQARITRVVYRDAYRDTSGLSDLKRVKIQVDQLPRREEEPCNLVNNHKAATSCSCL